MAGNLANKKQPKLNHAQIQTSSYGVAITNGWGTFRTSPNLLWMGPLNSTAVKTTTGGKGGATKSSSYNYSASVIMGICAGPIVGVKEVFKDQSHYVDGDLHTRYSNIASALTSAGSPELASDYTTLAAAAATLNTGGTTALSSCGVSLATGTLGQTPQPFLSGDDAIGYSLLAYAYAQNYDLSSSATLPSHTFTVSTNTRAVVGGQTLDDANPADILTDFLENSYRSVPSWKSGWIGDLTEYRTANTAYSLFLSYGLTTQSSAASLITTLMQCSNSNCFFSEGVLKVRPYSDVAKTANGVTFTPNLTPVFSLFDDDFIAQDNEDPVRISIKDETEAYNIAQIQYEDRTHQYNTVSVSASDPSAIEMYGERREQAVSMDAIKMPSVATAIARLRVQRTANIWETYSFSLGPEFAILEPMDLLEITDTITGLNAKLVRITSISENGDMFDVEAEEMLVGASSAPLLGHQQPLTVVTDYNAAPGNTDAPTLINPSLTLTTGNGYEAWLAASGGQMWGGCEVWLSFDGANYSKVGEINGPARYGTLTSSLPSHADPDTTNTLSVTLQDPFASLLSSSTAGATAGATMCMVEGELISYGTSTLTGTGTYDLTYLRRGQNSSTISAHASGSPFVRIDDTLFHYPYTETQVGTTVHVKLPAFNIYGNALQDISSVASYSVVLNPGSAPISHVIADGIVGQGDLATQDYADWASQVTGIAKPADYATKSYVYRSTTAPTGASVNDVWTQIDGSGNALAMYAWNGSSWIKGGDITAINTAAAIAGQSAWATFSSLTPAQVTAPGANLIYNGGLALGGDGWSTAGFFFGQGVGDIGYYAGSTTTNQYISGRDFPCAGGSQYTVSCKIGGSGSSWASNGPYAGIQYFDNSNNYLGEINNYSQAVPNAGYLVCSVTGTAPPGTTHARPFFYTNSNLGGGTVLFSEFKAELGSVRTLFNDAATNGALYSNGQTINALKPQESGANVTETRTAAAFYGQGALATLNQADWASQVTGIAKPADYATRTYVYRATSAPTAISVNDIWVQIDGSGNALAVYAWNGSSWIKGGDVTSNNTAAAIAGQGALATLNQADWATRVTGVGKPDDYANKSLVTISGTAPTSPSVNDIWVYTISGVAQSTWAWNGSTWVTSADITSYNTAAGFTGQGSMATQNANSVAITGGSLNINSNFLVNSSGDVTIRNSTTGARLEITNSLVQVYDSSGTLRVKLGVW